MAKKKANRRPANRYIGIIDELNAAILASDAPKTVVNELLGIEYITCSKYLDKTRNITDPAIAKRMVVVKKLLTAMVAKNLLPIEDEVNKRLRKDVILQRVDEFLKHT